MVKSINPSTFGQFNHRKRKVWININESDPDSIEYEAIIIDYSGLSILLYNKKCQLFLFQKCKNKINLLV